jgi:hypothetical protein
LRVITSSRRVPGRWTFPERHTRRVVRDDMDSVTSCPAVAHAEQARHVRRGWTPPLSETPLALPGSNDAEHLPQGSQRPPLRRHLRWRPLPPACASFGPTSPDAAHVPSSPFFPASTASSANGSAGLLHPAADHGVHRVSAHRDRMPATASALPHRCLPSRAFPSREASPASPRDPAPLPFVGDADPATRPCSARESVTTADRFQSTSPDALLGFPNWSPTCEPARCASEDVQRDQATTRR